jgi:hypothetical protein
LDDLIRAERGQVTSHPDHVSNGKQGE